MDLVAKTERPAKARLLGIVVPRVIIAVGPLISADRAANLRLGRVAATPGPSPPPMECVGLRIAKHTLVQRLRIAVLALNRVDPLQVIVVKDGELSLLPFPILLPSDSIFLSS